jgi:hypothetical protein
VAAGTEAVLYREVIPRGAEGAADAEAARAAAAREAAAVRPVALNDHGSPNFAIR